MPLNRGAADRRQHRQAAGAAAEASMIVAGWPACARCHGGIVSPPLGTLKYAGTGRVRRHKPCSATGSNSPSTHLAARYVTTVTFRLNRGWWLTCPATTPAAWRCSPRSAAPRFSGNSFRYRHCVQAGSGGTAPSRTSRRHNSHLPLGGARCRKLHTHRRPGKRLLAFLRSFDARSADK